MSIVNQAMAAGFTHVVTMGGNVPIEQFFLRDALGMTFDAERGVFLSPPRPASEFEIAMWEARGNPPMIGLQACDQWPLAKEAA